MRYVKVETSSARNLSRNKLIPSEEIRIGTALLETIDETLEMLGAKVKLFVYHHLDKKFGLQRDEIPSKVEIFSKGLMSLFGSISKQIELLILKKLCQRLMVDGDFIHDGGLSEGIRRLKEHLLQINADLILEK